MQNLVKFKMSYSPNDFLFPNSVGPIEQFGTHEILPWGTRQAKLAADLYSFLSALSDIDKILEYVCVIPGSLDLLYCKYYVKHFCKIDLLYPFLKYSSL